MPVVRCWILCIVPLTIILFLMFHLFAHYTICHNAGVSVYMCHLSNMYSVYEDMNFVEFQIF